MSHRAGSPVDRPLRNHFWRCSADPCVQDSCSTRPEDFSWLHAGDDADHAAVLVAVGVGAGPAPLVDVGAHGVPAVLAATVRPLPPRRPRTSLTREVSSRALSLASACCVSKGIGLGRTLGRCP